MIKIYFNHIPGNIHPVYQEMLDNQPEGVEYINRNVFLRNYEKTAISRNNLGFFSKIIYIILSFFKKNYFLPNITFKKLPGDIIYSCQTIPIFGEYILDMDCYESLNRFSPKISGLFLNKLIVKFFLSQKRCKKVVFWSEAAKKSFQSYLGNEFDYKLELLYPAIMVRNKFDKLVKLKDKEKINILFVGRYFERKGGLELVEIIKKYKDRNDIFFHIVSSLSKEMVDFFSGFENLKYYGLLPREGVLGLYEKSDIFLMPTFYDIFGFVFLESYSFGCIPISLEDYCTKEIINNNIDGFVIEGYKQKYFNPKTHKYIDKYLNLSTLIKSHTFIERKVIVEKIFEKIEFLINNREIRTEFMKKGFEKVENGKFSMEHRNKKLKSIL